MTTYEEQRLWYLDNIEKLVEEHAGKYILVHEDLQCTMYDTPEELDSAVEQYGLQEDILYDNSIPSKKSFEKRKKLSERLLSLKGHAITKHNGLKGLQKEITIEENRVKIHLKYVPHASIWYTEQFSKVDNLHVYSTSNELSAVFHESELEEMVKAMTPK